ncbi:uncharacterized protein [Drosophila tropicalis]|uniref:uncharacterized protein n=1 Tax=Drosophila tropicalis TaxID=46794 RepID=UPI0035AB72E3
MLALLLICFVCAQGATTSRSNIISPVAIIKSQAEQQTDGSYYFAYEAADGSYRQEVGLIAGPESELDISGAYGYINDNGDHVQLPFYLCLVALCMVSSLPLDNTEKEVVPILKSETNKYEDGSYKLEYESGDGTRREEQASVINQGTEDEALEVKGSYKYINEDGQEVEVFYTAGVNGFVPYGSIINSEITAVAEAAKDLPKEVPSDLKA